MSGKSPVLLLQDGSSLKMRPSGNSRTEISHSAVQSLQGLLAVTLTFNLLLLFLFFLKRICRVTERERQKWRKGEILYPLVLLLS